MTVTYTFSAGTLIQSAQVNQDFVDCVLKDGSQAATFGAFSATTDPGAAAGRTYFDSSATRFKVCNDGSNFFNISDYPHWDAIVAATGGDYTTLSAALAASKKSIFIRNGTYTETSAISFSTTNVTIVGESRDGVIIDLTTAGSGSFTISGTDCTIETITIRSAGNADHVILGANNIRFYNVTFINAHSSNPGSTQGMLTDNNSARTGIELTNCTFSNPVAANMQNRNAIWIRASGTQIVAQGISIIGSNNIMSAMNVASNYSIYDNFFIKNIGNTGTTWTVMTIGGTNSAFSNFMFQNISGDNPRTVVFASTLIESTMSGWQTVDAVTFDFSCTRTKIVNFNTQVSGTCTVAVAAAENHFSNCDFGGGNFTVNGNRNMFFGCKFANDGGGSSNTVSVASGATSNIFSNVMIDNVFADSGTGTVASYEVI